MRYLLLFIVFLQNVNCLTQIRENFTDGEFLSNPSWQGNVGLFQVNAEKQAQLDDNQAGLTYIGLLNLLDSTTELEWSFWTRQSFSPSGSNYGRFYLLADNSDLTQNPNGYYIQLGASGSNDAVELWEQKNGADTLLLSGDIGAIASSFELHAKLIYDASHTWIMQLTYVGNNSPTADSLYRPLNVWGEYSGWVAKYTASNSKKFYLDDLYIGTKQYDSIGPVLVDLNYQKPDTLFLVFSETLSIDSIGLLEVSIEPNMGVQTLEIDSNCLVLKMNQDWINGTNYLIEVNGLYDLYGNLGGGDTSFHFLIPDEPQQGELILTELMIDPTPSVGLPETEYIEIFNASEKYLSLKNIRIGDSGSGATIGDTFIHPHSYLLLVPTGADTLFPEALALNSWPSLTNSGDAVFLELTNGQVIDSVVYDINSYQDNDKKEGGFSLERTYLQTNCSTIQNWQASESAIGGTPAGENSINQGEDLQAPELQEFTFLEQKLVFQFDEPLDLLEGLLFQASFPISIDSMNQYGGTLMVYLMQEIPVSQDLSLTIDKVQDCNGNDTSYQLNFLRGKIPEKGDLFINEIFFDPPSGGADFVELYNESDYILDLKTCFLGRRKELEILWSDELKNERLLYSKEYLVFSADSAWTIQAFETIDVNRIFSGSLPTFPNDSATMVLMCGNEILEEFTYRENWHSSLIEDTEGKSLERLSRKLDPTEANSWHTAAETVGFATPGRENSQQLGLLSDDQFFLVSPVISPDNDGFEDFLTLQYQLDHPGWILNATIYDPNGLPYFHWEQNTLLGVKGNLKWDGQNDDGQVADIGPYILWLEVYHPVTTEILRRKMTVVVARKL